MRRTLFAGLLIAVSLCAPGAHASPVTQDQCPGTFTASVWKQVGNDVLENLLFSSDSLFVSDSTANAVKRFDTGGNEIAGGILANAPGGLVEASDGSIFAGTGDSFGSALQRSGTATVVRFTPGAQPQVYARGFNMVNGLIMAPNGDLFLSNDVDKGLYRVPASDPAHPELVNDTWGANGMVLAGTTLYAAITFDQRSPIAVIDLATGTTDEIQLSFGAASLEPNVYTNGDPSQPLVGLKGLDDMTSDGQYLYPVSNGMGELLRVDPATKSSCVVTGGMPNLSSVRIAPKGSAFDVPGSVRTFYLTDFHGSIRRIAQMA